MKFRTYQGARPGIHQIMSAVAAPGGSTYDDTLRDLAYVDNVRSGIAKNQSEAALNEQQLHARGGILGALRGVQLPEGLTPELAASLYVGSQNPNLRDYTQGVRDLNGAPLQREAAAAGRGGDNALMNALISVDAGKPYLPHALNETGAIDTGTGDYELTPGHQALAGQRQAAGRASDAAARVSDAQAAQRGFMELAPGASLYDLAATGGPPGPQGGIVGALPGAPQAQGGNAILDALPGAQAPQGVIPDVMPSPAPPAYAPPAPGPRLVATAPGRATAGQSLTVGADGTVQFTQGGGPITGPTLNKIEDKIINQGDTLAQITAIRSKFRPEFQEIGTRVGAKWAALKAKAGGAAALSPDEKGLLRDFSAFRAEAGQMFSLTLKELSGAAVTPPEMKRAEAWLPNPGNGITDGDDPVTLQTKLDRFEEFTRRALMKYHYIRNNGLTINDVDVDQMPQVMQQRGDAVYAEITAQGLQGDEARAATLQRLADEFGLMAN